MRISRMQYIIRSFSTVIFTIRHGQGQFWPALNKTLLFPRHKIIVHNSERAVHSVYKISEIVKEQFRHFDIKRRRQRHLWGNKYLYAEEYIIGHTLRRAGVLKSVTEARDEGGVYRGIPRLTHSQGVHSRVIQ